MAEQFPTASTLRDQKKASSTIHSEIMNIESSILTASEGGALEVTISDSLFTTAGATAQSYYSVWKNLTTDRLLTLNMDQVIAHFENLGYSIVRVTNDQTGNTFSWEIKW